MSQKTVLITGASSGMGKRTAFHLAGKNYKVFAGVRTLEDKEILQTEASHQGVSLNIVYLDVQSSISINKAVQEVIDQASKIDVLVNNAGFGVVATVEEGTDEEMLKQFDVNVFGVFRMCRAVLPSMRKHSGGVIINVSSFLGRMGFPLLTYYNASKYAVEALTDSLRYEVNRFGIRVHSVMPGLFGTNFVKKGLLVNQATLSKDSPYAELVARIVPLVAEKINQGPDPIPVAEAIAQIIEDEHAPIRVPVGTEAINFLPMIKQMNDEDFEKAIRETFGI